MSDSTSLVRYEAMCTAIAECVRVDEAKDIRDKALALEAYMRQAENLEAERLACNVRLRAERRCGEILASMKANGERASAGGTGSNAQTSKRPTSATLADLGVSRDQASRFQQLADVPEKDFEAALAEPEKPSTAGIIRRSRPTNGNSMDDGSLWVWGRLRDFERLVLGRYPADLVEPMTPAMRADVKRLAPVVSAWLADLSDRA